MVEGAEKLEGARKELDDKTRPEMDDNPSKTERAARLLKELRKGDKGLKKVLEGADEL